MTTINTSFNAYVPPVNSVPSGSINSTNSLTEQSPVARASINEFKPYFTDEGKATRGFMADVGGAGDIIAKAPVYNQSGKISSGISSHHSISIKA